MNTNVKITVLKRILHKELLEKYAESNWEPCERQSEGKEFVSEGVNIPPGFCGWAWAGIQKYVLTLARGGDFIGVKPGLFITCCTNGFREVVFKLERI